MWDKLTFNKTYEPVFLKYTDVDPNCISQLKEELEKKNKGLPNRIYVNFNDFIKLVGRLARDIHGVEYDYGKRYGSTSESDDCIIC